MMDGVVVARTQRCRHAPRGTSVALRPETSPNSEGNAGDSARVQVTFCLSHQQRICNGGQRGRSHWTTPTNHRVGELGQDKHFVSALSSKQKSFFFFFLALPERPGSLTATLEVNWLFGGGLVWDQP